MKFNSKFVLALGFLFASFTQTVMAQDHSILITYDEHERMAQWMKTVMSGPNINAPESIVEVKQMKNPCTPQKERLMHFCIDSDESFKIIVLQNEQVKEAFSHLVEPEVVMDEEAISKWKEMRAHRGPTDNYIQI